MGWFDSDDTQYYQVVIRHLFSPDEIVLDRVSMDEARQFVESSRGDGKEYVIQPSR